MALELERPVKLRIFVYSDRDISKLVNTLSKRVEFVVERIDSSKVSWEAYGTERRIPNRGWLTKMCTKVNNQYGKRVDGVMFILDTWEDGTIKLNGFQPGPLFAGYDIMLINGHRSFDIVAPHELKHTLDNLVRRHLNINLEDMLSVNDYDDDIVHKKFEKYRFEYLLDDVWPYIEKVVEQRRLYYYLGTFQKLLEDLKFILSELSRNKTPIDFLPESKSELYKIAKSLLGTDVSPKDLVKDGVGCAESFSTLVKTYLDKTFPIVTGTWSLYDQLEKSENFKKLTEADEDERGDIYLYVTGMGNGNISNGHVLICSDNAKMMSNDSESGMWLENYSKETMQEYWKLRGRYPEFRYRFKNN